jgi:hypothetical protein
LHFAKDLALLEAQGNTWKAYAENLPDGYVQECYTAFQAGNPPPNTKLKFMADQFG